MFRIRFTSGEEAIFRTVDELADGIRKGLVPATAEIFHAKSQQWLPIAVHPVYPQTAPRAASAGANGPLETQGPSIRTEISGGTFQIYHMVSQSAIELAQRRRPQWLGPAASVACGLAVVAGLTWVIVPSSIAAPDTGLPLVAREMSSVVPSNPFSTQAVRGWTHSPSNLAIRLARVGDSAALQLAARARQLGLDNLLTADRLGSPRRVEATRGALVSFEGALASHRGRERERSSAYVDSAEMFARSGAWSRKDVEEWGRRARPPESAADAARGDSLLVALDRLYTILFDQEGAYRISPDGARFTSLAAGDQYDGIRRTIEQLVEPRDGGASQTSATLLLLLALVGDGTLPPRLNN
jgi:hypothetical protein